MRLILDAGPMISQVERSHPYKAAARRVLTGETESLVLSPTVAGEIDYLMQKRGGAGANRTFLRDLAQGRFTVPALEPQDFKVMADLNLRYAALDVGLADLSIVVLALRYQTRRILTFDQRHFRTLAPLQGGSFTLLPFDDDLEN
jgi:uncharacterized protein